MAFLRVFRNVYRSYRSSQRLIRCMSTLGVVFLFAYAVTRSGLLVNPSARGKMSVAHLDARRFLEFNSMTQKYKSVAGNKLMAPLLPTVEIQERHEMLQTSTGNRKGVEEWVRDFRIGESFMKKAKVKYGKDGCVIMGVDQTANESYKGIACSPHYASSEACKFANRLYYQEDALKQCRSKYQVEICEVLESSSVEGTKFLYKCSFGDCQAQRRSHVAVRATEVIGRKVTLLKLFDTAEALQFEMPTIARQANSNGYSYLFLECSNSRDDVPAHEIIGQLLILPPYELIEAAQKRRVSNDRENVQSQININLLFLDSIARPHFYRSLPSVVEALRALNSDPAYKAAVLDFELFQAIEGHTAENAHALLTGKLFPKDFSSSERESSPVGYGELFEKFSKMGYHVAYQDDLCYDEFWGIRLELGLPGNYEDFDRRLKDNFIHSTGLTFASCRLLKLNGVNNPFNGPDHPLCYNNRLNGEYYLEYAMRRHHFASSRRIPLFTYSVLNVAHDHTGRRVQSVDWVLSEYVRRSAALENTLTVILSDHGNTYAPYTHAILEGRFEQFHPFLVMIIPDSLQTRLGGEVMENLRVNQKRLFTMLDVHYALASVPSWMPADVANAENRGMLSKISSTRTCEDLTLRLPNQCICEGWGTAVSNTTEQSGVLEFAVGQMNNMISLAQAGLPHQTSRRCKRLLPVSFFDIVERNGEGNLVSSFNFAVPSGNGATTAREIFTVQVSSSILPGSLSRDMKLLSYDRQTRFAPYELCRDQVVDKRLCICDIVEATKRLHAPENAVPQSVLAKPAVFPVVQEISNRTKCVHYITRKYVDPDSRRNNSIWSASFEVANLCGAPVGVTLGVELHNMRTTQKFPVKVTVPPYTIYYLGGVMRRIPYWSSSIVNYDFLQSADDTHIAIGFK